MMLAKIIIHLLFLIGFVLLTMFETTILILLFWIANGLRLSEIPVIGLFFYHFIDNLHLSYLVMWVLVGIVIYFRSKKRHSRE